MADTKKVLVAEDSSVIQNLTKKILQFQNFEITSAKNGEQVLKMLEKDKYEISDVTMERSAVGYVFKGQRSLSPEEQAERKSQGGPASTAKTTRFKVLLPDLDEPIKKILDDLTKRGVKVKFVEETRFLSYISALFPILLLVAFLWLILRQGGGMGGGGPRGIFSFGKSKKNNRNGFFGNILFCRPLQILFYQWQ